MTSKLIKHALNLVRPQFRLNEKFSLHGISHWARVWRNARELCDVYEEDYTVPCLFAFLHDSQRYNDGRDEDHGLRACQWVEYLYLNRKIDISPSNFHLLTMAIAGHSYGETRADRIVQICWDSDRLDLGRVGIIPNPLYLCTDHAKSKDMIARSYYRSVQVCERSLNQK